MEGRIRLTVGMKKNIRVMLQGVIDEFRYDIGPKMSLFPITNIEALIRRQKTHDLFIEKAKELSSATESEKL